MYYFFTFNLFLKSCFRPCWLWPLALVSLLYLASCSGTSKLPEGQKLYTGATVKLNAPQPVPNKTEVLASLQAVITPQPNTSFLGMRPGIFFYNLGGEKGIGKFIREKLGQEPVLYDSVNARNITSLMVNRLNNHGYFSPSVSYAPVIKKNTASVVYTANVSKPYTIAKIEYPTGDTLAQVYRDIANSMEASLLQVGDPYNLATFTNERVRIDADLKNKGYFYFSPEFLLFQVDSTQNNYTVNVNLRIKATAPSKGLVPYTLDDIFVYTDFDLSQDSLPQKPPMRVNGYHYFPDEESLKARHLLPAVFIEKGKLYSRQDHALTLSRLNGFGLFNFVDMKFRDDSLTNQLDADIRLTPMQLHSLRAELEMVTQNNNFAGPGIAATYRHRNLMRGAEQFQLRLNASQQSFVGGNRSGNSENQGSTGGLNSFELGAQAELNVPRFMTPFNLTNLRSQFVPRTRFTLGFNYLNRVNYFQMMGYNATYGYVWRPKRRITHEVTPVNLQYVQLGRVDSAFQQLLNTRPYLRRSFEEQFILGSIYNFNYNTQEQKTQKNHFYFNTNIDLSGNLLNIFKTQVLKENNDPNTIARRAYAQYARLDFDTRYYFGINSKSQIATRMLIGVGIPYGNSRNLPYVKQFFVGGPNSIRAFRPRAVGPGAYLGPTSQSDNLETNSGFFDQTGDIRFETNVEYRFDIIPYLKGAVFLDAGNIWLARADEAGTGQRTGGEFVLSKALSQLAVGTGMGLRIDADFFVLRFDLGIPIRNPYEASPLVFKLPPERGGMVFHIAVGYPF